MNTHKHTAPRALFTRVLTWILIVALVSVSSGAEQALAVTTFGRALLVNTEAFDFISYGDDETDIELRFGDATRTLLYDVSLGVFAFSHGLYVRGTLSGNILHAEKELTSSGTLVTESGAYIAGTSLVVQKNNGFVGIGTASPQHTLDVAGEAYFGVSEGASAFTIYSVPQAINHMLIDGDSQFMLLQGDPNPTSQTVGIGRTTQPKAKLDVFGTISGTHLTISKNGSFSGSLNVVRSISGSSLEILNTASGKNLFALSSITGTHLYASGTFAGAGLTECKDPLLKKLLWDSETKKFVCGNDWNSQFSNTGALQTAFDNRYVNTSGDTMTGTLAIRPTAGSDTVGLNVAATMSGRWLNVMGTGATSLLFAGNGRVGIGTTAPSRPLEISANGGAAEFVGLKITNRGNQLNDDASIEFSSAAGASVPTSKIAVQQYAGGSSGVRFNFFIAGSSALQFSHGGDFYWNTNPASQLSTSGLAFGANTDGRTQSYIRQETMAGFATKLHLGTAAGVNNATTKMTIDNLGNVGIGITSPKAKLDVGGTISGRTLTVSGNGSFTGSLNVVRGISGSVIEATTLSGRNLFAISSVTGTHLYASGTFGGAGLTDCTGTSNKLTWLSATKRFSCETDQAGSGGMSYATASGIFLKRSGGTMTGTLTIAPTTSFRKALNIVGSGSYSIATISGGSIVHTARGNNAIVGGVKDATDLDGANYVAVAGRYAYVATSINDSLRIIDISNPTSPSIIGGVVDDTNLDGASSVAIAGRYAYVATSTDNSLRIIDISNPTSPSIVGGVKDDIDLASASSVAVAGRYAYVTAPSNDSLRIIDISNPLSPLIVGGIQDNTNLASAYAVAVAGRYAYVANYDDSSLRIIDISNPASPSIVGGVKDDTNLAGPLAVAVAGRYAYVAASDDSSLRIIDISNPASPSIVGGVKNTTTLSAPFSVAVAGRYAYVAATGNNSLRIIDISNPASPSIVGGIQDNTNLAGAIAVAVAGRYAYVATSGDDSLRVIDLNGLDTPTASIGALNVGRLDVLGDASFNKNLTIERSLNVGDGLYVFGQTSMRAFSGSALTLSTQDKTGKPALNVLGSVSGAGLLINGTATGRNLFAISSITGAHINATSTFAGAGLSDCDNATTSKLLWDASNKRFSCGTDQSGSGGNWSGTGALQTAFDNRYVNTSGDTMTGTLVFSPVSGLALNAKGTISGSTLHISGDTNLSGSLLNVKANTVRFQNRTNSATAFQIKDRNDNVVFNVGTTSNRVGIGTDDPQHPLHVVLNGNNQAYMRFTNTKNGANAIAGVQVEGQSTDFGFYAHAASRSVTRYGITVGGWSEVIMSNLVGNSNGLLFGFGSSDKPIVFGSNDTVRAVLQAGGNFGIGHTGLTDAETKLDVLGTISGTHLTVSKNGSFSGSLNVVRGISGSVIEAAALSGRNLFAISSITGAHINATSTFAGAGLTNCTGTSNKLTWLSSTKKFACETDEAGSGGMSYATASGIFLKRAGGNLTGTLITNVSTGSLKVQSGANVGTNVLSIATDGNVAYVGITSVSGNDLRIFDIRNPARPTLIGGMDLGASAQEVFVAGKYLYIGLSSVGGNDFVIYDLSRPNAPSLVGGLDLSTGVQALHVAGTFAYVGGANATFYVIDISNPRSPKQVGSLASVNADDIYVKDRVAHVARVGMGHIDTIDVTYPNNLKYLDVGGPAAFYSTHALDVSGKYIYSAVEDTDSDAGYIHIQDISNPASLTQVSQTFISTDVFAIATVGKYLAVGTIANASTELRIFDVSVPASPRYVTGYEFGVDVNVLRAQGSSLFVGLDTVSGIDFVILTVAGIEAHAASIGALQANNLHVGDDASVFNDLSVGGALEIGQGLHALGPSTIANAFSGAYALRVISTSSRTGALAITAHGGSNAPHLVFGSGAAFDANLYRLSANLLQTDGSLTVKGTLSGSTFFGANLVDCDNATTSKLMWDASTGKFSCGTDQSGGSSGGGISYATASGIFLKRSGGTMTGRLIIDINGQGVRSSGTGLQLYEKAVFMSGAVLSGTLILKSRNDPPAPTNGDFALYTKKIANRTMLKGKGPSGLDYPYQPSFFQNQIIMISTGGGTALSLLGTTGTATTATHTATDETYGYMTRFTTTAVSGNDSGFSSANTLFIRGSTAGANGFFYNARIGVPGNTGAIIFSGLTSASNLANTFGSANPAGHHVGFQFATTRADTNWQFMTKDGTTQNLVDTGIAVSNAKVYDFFFFCSPQCSTIYWRVDNVTDNTTAEGSTSSNLPGSATALRIVTGIETQFAGTRILRMQRIYVESDR